MDTNTQPHRKIDYSKAIARKKFLFAPFRPTRADPLRSAKLQPDEDLLIIEKAGVRTAFILRQMVYHHLAQYEINDDPYLVSF